MHRGNVVYGCPGLVLFCRVGGEVANGEAVPRGGVMASVAGVCCEVIAEGVLVGN